MGITDNSLLTAVKALSVTIARLTKKGELRSCAVPGLSLFCKTETSEPLTGIYDPSICLITQGAKKVILGTETYIYDSKHYLLSGLSLPVTAQIIKASPESPYLGLRLTFDYSTILSLMTESKLTALDTQKTERGMSTGFLTLSLVNAFQRLIDLLDTQEDIPILSPIIQREIFYRLLTGEQGNKLRQLAIMGTKSQQVAETVAWLKLNFMKNIRIEDLAEMADMGTSTYHNHFRNMTALSPLQYQKRLRLQEARRLMLTEHIDAATASLHVGYESPSQFSREYSRLYGLSPIRDISTIRKQSDIASV